MGGERCHMPKRPGWGLVVLRVVVGLVFLAHGTQKLVAGFASVARTMGTLGVPTPLVAGVAVTLVEFVGGILLVAGLFTRWAALLLALEMAVAIVDVHLANGFFLPRGFEYALTLLAANACLVLAGPETFSLDAHINPGGYWK